MVNLEIQKTELDIMTWTYDMICERNLIDNTWNWENNANDILKWR